MSEPLSKCEHVWTATERPSMEECTSCGYVRRKIKPAAEEPQCGFCNGRGTQTGIIPGAGLQSYPCSCKAGDLLDALKLAAEPAPQAPEENCEHKSRAPHGCFECTVGPVTVPDEPTSDEQLLAQWTSSPDWDSWTQGIIDAQSRVTERATELRVRAQTLEMVKEIEGNHEHSAGCGGTCKAILEIIESLNPNPSK